MIGDLKNNNNYLSKATVLLLSMVVTNVWGLTMSGEPVYPPGKSKSVYIHLADYLSEKIHQDIDLKVEFNFQQHWHGIKEANSVGADIIVEEAPLTDYFSNYHGYVPLVRDKENLSYSLVSLNHDYKKPDDLFLLPVATLPAPSTDYLVLQQWFPDFFLQPQVISSSVSWEDSVQQVWDGVAVAAVIPTKLAEFYPQFNVITTNNSMPGLTVSVSPSITLEVREEILGALLMLNDDAENYTVLHELDILELQRTEASHYEGYSEWLRPNSRGHFPEPVIISPQ